MSSPQGWALFLGNDCSFMGTNGSPKQGQTTQSNHLGSNNLGSNDIGSKDKCSKMRQRVKGHKCQNGKKYFMYYFRLGLENLLAKCCNQDRPVGRALLLVVKMNIKHNIKICIISGLGQVKTISNPSAAARTGQGAE